MADARCCPIGDDSRRVSLSLSRLVDLALHILVGVIVTVACSMIILTSLLCLYGYYKWQRRRFHRFIEQQTMKFHSATSVYKSFGQQRATIETPSSPYVIQSTSI
jgi:predicted RND superfamily exporter protein